MPISPLTADPAQLPHDLSPWGMFLSADMVVQGVMLGLLLASVATWSVFAAKLVELRQGRRRLREVGGHLSSSRSLAEAAQRLSAVEGIEARLAEAALEEVQTSPAGNPEGVKERVASRLERAEVAASRAMTMGTGILATIGSTAPFIGLFGTVWGIMNSFVGISKAQTTNLAVVAPGIAEALLATAIGLVAAIPAVVIYNALARSVAGYRSGVGDLTAEILRMVGRDLDRRRVPMGEAAE